MKKKKTLFLTKSYKYTFPGYFELERKFVVNLQSVLNIHKRKEKKNKINNRFLCAQLFKFHLKCKQISNVEIEQN